MAFRNEQDALELAQWERDHDRRESGTDDYWSEIAAEHRDFAEWGFQKWLMEQPPGSLCDWCGQASKMPDSVFCSWHCLREHHYFVRVEQPRIEAELEKMAANLAAFPQEDDIPF